MQANDGAQRLFGELLAPESLPEPANVLDLMIQPGPVRDAVLNWDAVVPELLDRCRREAIGRVIDPATAERLEGFRSRPDVAGLVDEAVAAKSTLPVIDVDFAFGSDRLSFFSVVSTIGTPIDITTQELPVEAFAAQRCRNTAGLDGRHRVVASGHRSGWLSLRKRSVRPAEHPLCQERSTATSRLRRV
jgi:hypothetical protein